MWSSWRWFSCWIAAHSSGSDWARLLLEGNMAPWEICESKILPRRFCALAGVRRRGLGTVPQRLPLRKLGRAPVAAQCLQQRDRGDQPPAEYDHGGALVVEPRRLHRDHV